MEELKLLISGKQGALYNMIQYQLGWLDEHGMHIQASSGKLLRPGLCLLTCEALGQDFHKALPAAAAIELVHNFSLVHDDVQDGTMHRRQHPTLWWLWGPAQAINVGDALHALARLALLRLQQIGQPEEKVLRALRILDEASLKLCEGQHLDLVYQERLDITLSSYLNMVAGKTGALMSAAIHLGALVCSDDSKVLDACAQCGLNLGVAFQMRDDMLDLWSEPPGEVSGGDLLIKKKSLPIVLALERGTFKQKRELGNIYFKRVLTTDDLKAILAILDELDVKRRAEELAQQYLHNALDALKGVDLLPEGGTALEKLAHFMVLPHSQEHA